MVLPSSSGSLRMGVPAVLVNALDNSIRADLQRYSQDMFVGVSVSTAVLAVGCLFEGPELILELWPSWFTWPSKKMLEACKHKLKIFGLIGWLFVGIGILGEGVFEGLQDHLQGQLQTLNDTLLSDARLTASEAETSASNSDLEAAEARKETAQLGNDTQRLKAEVALANERAEAETLARVKIDASVVWRHLSDQQSEQMSRELEAEHLAPKPITITFFDGDAEGARFAADIAKMLRGSGIPVFPPQPLQPPGLTAARITDPITSYATGVEVQSTKDDPTIALANGICKKLIANGFDAHAVTGDAADSFVKHYGPNIVIAVMPRPGGPQGEYKLKAEQVRKSKTAEQN